MNDVVRKLASVRRIEAINPIEGADLDLPLYFSGCFLLVLSKYFNLVKL